MYYYATVSVKYQDVMNNNTFYNDVHYVNKDERKVTEWLESRLARGDDFVHRAGCKSYQDTPFGGT
jgi:hypothetical protein